MKKWEAWLYSADYPDGPEPWIWLPYRAAWLPEDWKQYGLPLWMPLLFGVGLTTVAKIRGRRCPPHLCPTCNFDLTGIDGVCPECGRPRP